MTYCNEKGMACEWASIDGACSVSACRKTLFTPGGWPIQIEQLEFVRPACICKGITSISGALNGTGPVPNDSDHLLAVDYDGDFNFCPICGRPL